MQKGGGWVQIACKIAYVLNRRPHTGLLSSVSLGKGVHTQYINVNLPFHGLLLLYNLMVLPQLCIKNIVNSINISRVHKKRLVHMPHLHHPCIMNRSRVILSGRVCVLAQSTWSAACYCLDVGSKKGIGETIGPIPWADQITKNELTIKKNWTLGPGAI